MPDAFASASAATRLETHYGDRVVRCYAERPASVHAMLAGALAARPDAEALVCGDERLSWRELDAQVGRIAAGLAARGIARGERVALFVGNRIEFVSVLFALARIGAIAVPIGVREQRPGLAYMLNQCEAAAVVFDAELAERVPGARASAAGDDAVPSLRLRVSIGPDGLREANTDADTRSSVARRGDVPEAISLAALAAPDDAPMPAQAAARVAEEDVAFILYTSGTTGHPKGAMLTHLSVAHSVLHFRECWGLGPDDRAVLAVPASHVTGLVAILATMASAGAATVIVPQFRAAEFVPLVARERVTYTVMVPAMYALCLMQPEFERADLSAWRIAGYGGAPMPPATIEQLAARLPGLVPVNAYGATETSSPATLMPLGATAAHADTVGVAAPCAQVIAVGDDGRELPPGEPGELWISGPMVVRGYWNNPQATASSFTAGWWHSGDVGSVDADGFVRVFDRRKDMLNRGGFKIYSAEVEATLMALPGMVEAAVVGVPCPVLGERVHAFVHAPGAGLDAERVRAHCAARLADYKVPETVTFSPEPLPRNANGKLMKRMLRERLAEAPAAGG